LGRAVKWFASQCQLNGEIVQDEEGHYWHIPILFEAKPITLTCVVLGDRVPKIIDGVSAAWGLAERCRKYQTYDSHTRSWVGEKNWQEHPVATPDSENIWNRMQTVGKTAIEVFGDPFGMHPTEITEQ
jgi:hypothetical protein